MSAYLDRTRDIDSMRVGRAAAELREELDEADVPLPPRVHRPLIQADPPISPPRRFLPAVVGSAADFDPAPVEASPQAPKQPLDVGNPLPSGEELPKRPELPMPAGLPGASNSQAGNRKRRPYWAAAAAAGLVAVSFGWLAFDRPNLRDTTRRGASAPAKVVVPAVGIDAAKPELNAPVAEKPVRALHPDGQSPARREARGVLEPAQPASQPVDARAAFGLAPSADPASASPPAAAPSCSEATKALGLCP
jgi:hypothetical protein